jgi:hypothetical protein
VEAVLFFPQSIVRSDDGRVLNIGPTGFALLTVIQCIEFIGMAEKVEKYGLTEPHGTWDIGDGEDHRFLAFGRTFVYELEIRH